MFSVSVVKPQWSGWREPFCWAGPKVALYESFDASSELVLKERDQQVDFVPLVSGKVNYMFTSYECFSKYLSFGFR